MVDLHGDGGATRAGGVQPADGSDDALAAALADGRWGDERAIAVLYRHFNPRLLRYLRHHVGDLAPDLASEVWLALAKNLHQ